MIKKRGLYYLIARYYNPIHGVFLSCDPNSGDKGDILTQNGYSYANNNPVRYVDPEGRWVKILKYTYKAYKSGYKIHKVGRIKGENEQGKGYLGIIYSKKKKSGKRSYSSLEWHTPHNNHGYHLQSNKFSKYQGKWKRGSARWRVTVWSPK